MSSFRYKALVMSSSSLMTLKVGSSASGVSENSKILLWSLVMSTIMATPLAWYPALSLRKASRWDMVSWEKVFWAASWLNSTTMGSKSLNTMSTAALPWPGAEV